MIDVSADLKDAGYDKTSAAAREMRTAELFEFCVGREFEIRGFQKGFVELEVSRDPSVRRKFGNGHTIWIEPQFLQRLAGKKRL